MEEGNPKFKPQLSQSSSCRRRASNDSSSPEFEFWMVGNPSCPPPNLLSADELFVDGVLLPLHLLPNHYDPSDPNPNPSDPPHPNPQAISELPVPGPEPTSEPRVPDPEPGPGPGPELSTGPALTASKRWRDIFKKGEKKAVVKDDENDKEKDKKKERKGGGGASSAELNINIWPFSRSRSAGNAYTRPKGQFGAPATRKVNSAPCSRSNSTGESKSRKWPPASPGRAGVHLGRSSPVWQVRRGGSLLGKNSSSEPQARNAEKGTKKEIPESRRSKTATVAGGGGGGAKARVLNLNVPMCIGYRSHLSCRSDENSAIGVGSVGGGSNRGGGAGNCGGGNGVGGHGGAGGNLFNLRSLFTKKVY